MELPVGITGTTEVSAGAEVTSTPAAARAPRLGATTPRTGAASDIAMPTCGSNSVEETLVPATPRDRTSARVTLIGRAPVIGPGTGRQRAPATDSRRKRAAPVPTNSRRHAMRARNSRRRVKAAAKNNRKRARAAENSKRTRVKAVLGRLALVATAEARLPMRNALVVAATSQGRQ